jgi:hypothetical protein
MAKKRTIHEQTFGDLTYVAGDLWKRPFQLKIFGKEWTVSLTVDIDPKDGVEENQVMAFNTFNAETSHLIAAAEKAILSYYQSVCKEYRSRYGISDPNDEKVPIVKSLKEVYKLVEPEGVTFPYVRLRPTFGILCQCTWEEERGLAVKFENGKIVSVGFQDIVL